MAGSMQTSLEFAFRFFIKYKKSSPDTLSGGWTENEITDPGQSLSIDNGNESASHDLINSNSQSFGGAGGPGTGAARTIAAGVTNTYDLIGALQTTFKGTLNFEKLFYIFVQNLEVAGALGTHKIKVHGAAANNVSTIFDSPGNGVILPPGGVFIWGGGNDEGAAIVGGTDKFAITNLDGVNAVQYRMFIMGDEG